MASAAANRLCPDAVFIRPRFDLYRAVSSQIREIFYEYTDLVEPLSLDEAFLDVTENHKGLPSATLIAQDIKRTIFQHQVDLRHLLASHSTNFLSKLPLT
jgi:DNA polymerase-4